MQYLSDICGIVVTDKSNPLQAAAYTAGLAAIGVGEGAWYFAHPTASAPMDTENKAGNLAWAFVYPSDVCDFMPPLRSAGAPPPPSLRRPPRGPPLPSPPSPLPRSLPIVSLAHPARLRAFHLHHHPHRSMHVCARRMRAPIPSCALPSSPARRQWHLLPSPPLLLRGSDPHLPPCNQRRHHSDGLRRVRARRQGALGLPQPVQHDDHAPARLLYNAVSRQGSAAVRQGSLGVVVKHIDNMMR